MKQALANFFRNQQSKERFGRLKKFKYRGFAALMLAVLIILSSIPVGYAAATPRRAVITVMEGSVLVQAAGQATAVPARKGMELKSGDRIITGKDGSCSIRYDDGSTTHIGPNSRVDMANLTRQGADGPNTTILSAQRGTLWNNAKDVMARNSRFEVNTPSAVAAVRGTFFKSVVLPNGDTLFIVLGGGLYISPADSDEDGVVSPPSGKGVYVGGGQQLGVSPGEELPDSAVPLDYDNVDDLTLLYLAQDNPDIFVELIERAAAQGEKEFLERVNQLLEDYEDMQQNLGDKLETVQQTVTQGTTYQPPASTGGGGGGDDDDDDTLTIPKQLEWKAESFYEHPNNDGTIGNVIAVVLTGETFALRSGEIMKEGLHYTAANVPDSLAIKITVEESGSQAIIELTGTATNHAAEDSISDLTITFLDAAFNGGSAAAVAGSSRADLGIEFTEWNVVGTPGFSEGAADCINLKVGYDGIPHVAYSYNDQVCVQQYFINGNIWDDPYLLENAANVSDISLYVDKEVPYVAFSDSEGMTIRKWNGYEYGWYPMGDSLTVENTTTDISLHVNYDIPYIAYITQSGGVTVAKCEYYDYLGYEWDEYPIVNDPESAGSATDVSLYVDSGNPYVAYSDSKGITVRKWMYDGVWSWQPIGSDPISSVDTTDTTDTTDATDVSLHVCTGTSFLAFRDQIGAVSVKYAFGGGDEVVWNEVVDDSEDEKSISVSSASSLSFAAIPSYYSDGPPPAFCRLQGFRWKGTS
ncbi:MAG: hypothetical protein GXZ07_02350 [Firmicutes bacterium]|nr:hypothetical protein [Bacillota bacterium]